MRRQIKFRVWNTATNEWVHEPGYEVNLFGEMILLGGFMKGVGCLELNDCIALQFTGLKDKDGKEIYEGDIVSGTYSWDVEMPAGNMDTDFREVKGEVVFEHGYFKVSTEKYNYEFSELTKVKIVGNKYKSV